MREALILTMCATIFLPPASMPVLAGAAAQPATAQSDAERYAEREAAATGLDEFQGGFHEVIIFLAVVGLLVLLVDWGHHGHYHHPHASTPLEHHPHGLGGAASGQPAEGY